MSNLHVRLSVLAIGFICVVFDQQFFGEREVIGLSVGQRMLALCMVGVGVLFATRILTAWRKSDSRSSPRHGNHGNMMSGTASQSGSTDKAARSWLLTILAVLFGGLLIAAMTGRIDEPAARYSVLAWLLGLWFGGLCGRFAWLVSRPWPIRKRSGFQLALCVGLSILLTAAIMRIPSTADSSGQVHSTVAQFMVIGLVICVSLAAVLLGYVASRVHR